MEEGRELAPGTRIGDFELLHPIGKGGMGWVWLARVQRKLGFEKLFAIKTILGDHSADTHFQNMFFDEARVASRITHPNVAQIFDLGQEDDLFYIVMEWVDGDSLHRVARSFMKRQHALLPLGIALRIVADSCAGLHAAHELVDDSGLSLEVVHRDVSPQNILVSAQGVTKIIDFGVAKARDRAVETRTGSLKGKLQYMAPEQALGEKVDRRADVFACGAVLYWLLTGKPPHVGESDIDILRAVANRAPMRPIPETVPAPVRDALTRMLTVAREDRYSTALEAQQALERAAAECGLNTTTTEVGAFARDVMSEEYEKRKRARTSALAKLDPGRPPSVSLSGAELAAAAPPPPATSGRAANADGPPTNIAYPSFDAAPPSGIIEPPDTAANNTLGSAAVDTPVSLPRKRRVAASLGIATGAVVGLLTVVVLSAMRGSTPKNSTAPESPGVDNSSVTNAPSVSATPPVNAAPPVNPAPLTQPGPAGPSVNVASLPNDPRPEQAIPKNLPPAKEVDLDKRPDKPRLRPAKAPVPTPTRDSGTPPVKNSKDGLSPDLIKKLGGALDTSQ